MKLTKLELLIKAAGLSPESLAEGTEDFSNMTVRRAIKGRGVDRLKAIAIVKQLGKKTKQKLQLEDVI